MNRNIFRCFLCEQETKIIKRFLFGFWCLVFVLGFFSMGPMAFGADGLVLWNGLGSDEEVLNSFVGPNLEFYTGGSWPHVQGDREYVTGYNGSGVTLKGSYSNMARVHNIVLNNLSNYIDPEKGCIELWYYYTEIPIMYHHGIYRLFGGGYGLGSGIGFQARHAEAGMPARITFNLTFGGHSCFAWYDLANIPNNEWVHLAVSWDRNGIDGTADSIRLYVNNEVVATTTDNNWGTIVGQRVDICGGNDEYVSGKFKMDELKIWNYAKTNFFVNPPAVTTTAVSSITATSASGGGNVTSDGGAAVTARGVCWSTSPNPTISDSHTSDGTGTGTFTSSITGLIPGTTYHVRAYATNSVGTSYGSDEMFTTNAVVSAVTTTAISNITSTTASSGGNVTYNGGTAITARGVCWSTSVNPDIADSHTSDGTGTGTFTSSITGLTPGTTYHVRAYAINSVGTSYGSDITFTTNTVTPIVTTTAVSDITAATASSGGDVTSDGGTPVTARGVCWSTSANPTISDSHTTDGTGTGTFTSSITGLTPNTTYYVRAYATNTEGTAYGNEVTFTTSIPPHIEVNRTRLNFGAIIGESQTGSQTLLIGNSGGGILNWAATPSETWIQVNPSSGTNSWLVTVSVDTTGLAAGTYTGTISIADASASNSPQSIPVFLNIYNPGTASVPFGEFSTPIDGSTIYSSIPVTGWVLDDIEVESVKIYREAGKNLYEIGEALFVEGPRPDVEQAYPSYPFNYRAVWCYMMLTNYLPNGGNGTFVITAVVTDSSGNEVTLGSKTIICDNANAVKPFGAIDTPTLGGDASGTDFINFGWALTPLPNTIPTDGSTINVWVDGVPLTGNPVYNRYREDIASRFPGYNNSDGAGGYYYLDTTLYANGIHTISWSVTDDAGNTDGIGSRYFRVLNVENLSTASAAAPGNLDKLSIRDLPVSSTPVYLDKGYKTAREREHYTQTLYPDHEEIINIEIKEGERIEIGLKDNNEIAWSMEQAAGSTNRWAGFLIVGDAVKPLPIGSYLDVLNGVFYWQPGPGFIGQYRFVFVEKGQNGEFVKKMIKVVIESKF